MKNSQRYKYQLFTLSCQVANEFSSFETCFNRSLDTTCWLWKRRVQDGRPRYSINGRNYIASRIAWLIYRGDNVNNLHVLHKCDNPLCVNPDHLFLGTQRDNLADMRAKGRQYRLITPLMGAQIKAFHSDGFTQAQLAGKFGVSRQAIQKYLSSQQQTNK